MDDFDYGKIPAFSDFSDITKNENFFRIPNDWIIIITDIKGSTRAIEEGRYKDVNTVGAASIVCVENAMGGCEFPFVFGGDGATLVIPPDKKNVVAEQLLALKELSIEQFQLELRIGAMEVSEASQSNLKVEVAKNTLNSKKSVAAFRGGGLAFAESKIKGDYENYKITGENSSSADLNGLSCRWQPIKSSKGRVLSILVEAIGENEQDVYSEIISKINKIFKGNLDDGNPININNMKYNPFSKNLENETRFHNNFFTLSFGWRLFEIFVSSLLFSLKISQPFLKTEKYSQSMKSHSDYRKFDEMLRMVLDCSEKQILEIERVLDGYHRSGQIFFGIHKSTESLMTCFVHGLEDGEHIHFVDGGSGGYAMAAKSLKKQKSDAIKIEEEFDILPMAA